jgi:hypothetical protein
MVLKVLSGNIRLIIHCNLKGLEFFQRRNPGNFSSCDKYSRY